ncbi:hypothetical protein GH721_01310 [Kriegella sp. EG-1]|nr:hypothetical protein [Flavobacteriaceae bacterium EG-1]
MFSRSNLLATFRSEKLVAKKSCNLFSLTNRGIFDLEAGVSTDRPNEEASIIPQPVAITASERYNILEACFVSSLLVITIISRRLPIAAIN